MNDPRDTQFHAAPAATAPDFSPPDAAYVEAKRLKRFSPLYETLDTLRAVDPDVEIQNVTPGAFSIHTIALTFTPQIKFLIEVYKTNRKDYPWECSIECYINTPEVVQHIKASIEGVEGSFSAWYAIMQATGQMGRELESVQYKVGMRSEKFPKFRSEAAKVAKAWSGWVKAVNMREKYQRACADVVEQEKNAPASQPTTEAPAPPPALPKATYWYVTSPDDGDTDESDSEREELVTRADYKMDTVADDIMDNHEQYFTSEPPYGGSIHIFDAPEGGNLIGVWEVTAEHTIDLSLSRKKKP